MVVYSTYLYYATAASFYDGVGPHSNLLLLPTTMSTEYKQICNNDIVCVILQSSFIKIVFLFNFTIGNNEIPS